MNSEWAHCRIRPLTCGGSLRDPQGYLWRTTEDAWRNVKAAEIEDELRAQVEHVLKLGIDVTHIDTHMGSVMRPDLAEIYAKLACHYKVPALIPDVTQYLKFNPSSENSWKLRTDETRDLPDIDIREGDFMILKDPEIRKLIERKWELIT